MVTPATPVRVTTGTPGDGGRRPRAGRVGGTGLERRILPLLFLLVPMLLLGIYFIATAKRSDESEMARA